MATIVLDESLGKRLQAERVASGADRYDEVWEGTYMMAPPCGFSVKRPMHIREYLLRLYMSSS